MRFDADVPQWAVEELEAVSDPKHYEILQAVLGAPSHIRGVVLQGLQKRSLKQQMGSIGKLQVLALGVQRGLSSRVGDALLSPQEKAKQAKRLAWAARELAEAWRAIDKSGWQVASTIGIALSSVSSEVLDSIEPYATKRLSRGFGNENCPDERRLLDHAVSRMDLVAERIAEGAESWARIAPPLDKPNHVNADRLWFIRLVTEQFLHHFGKPMREEVAALAEIWFGESTLTANALSEIATVEDVARIRWPSRIRPPSK